LKDVERGMLWQEAAGNMVEEREISEKNATSTSGDHGELT
jgi:hypothetical protein